MLVSASCVAQAGCAAPRRIAMPPRSRPAVLARPQRRSMAVRAADELDLVASSDPEDARGSIAIGLKYSAAGQWEQAQQYFERALELPGTGLKRWRDKPPALSAGELQAALYNVACCRSRLGDVENGLIAIAGAVEQGALRGRARGGGGALAGSPAAACRH